jgi:hypothetical protein
MTLVTSTSLTSNTTSPPTPSPVQQVAIKFTGPVSETDFNVYQAVDREGGASQVGIVGGKSAGITGGVTQVTRGLELLSQVKDGEMGVLSCIKLIYNNFDLKETNSSRVEVTSIPVCRDAPRDETQPRYFELNKL